MSDQILDVLSDALALVERTGERYQEAEIHRLRGALLLLQGSEPDSSRAEDAFAQALAVARRQQARSTELRAATEGRREDAHWLLAPIYDWFTEGHDLADLQEAKALLAQVRGDS